MLLVRSLCYTVGGIWCLRLKLFDDVSMNTTKSSAHFLWVNQTRYRNVVISSYDTCHINWHHMIFFVFKLYCRRNYYWSRDYMQFSQIYLNYYVNIEQSVTFYVLFSDDIGQ